MTTKAELEQEVQDNWDAFLDMQTRCHELTGALIRIKALRPNLWLTPSFQDMVGELDI